MGTADIQSVCNILSKEEETENRFKTDLEKKLKTREVGGLTTWFLLRILITAQQIDIICYFICI